MASILATALSAGVIYGLVAIAADPRALERCRSFGRLARARIGAFIPRADSRPAAPALTAEDVDALRAMLAERSAAPAPAADSKTS